MLNYFWVGLGGALGSMARFWGSSFVARHWGETFPFGTLIINVTGSFLIGFFATLTDTDGRLLVSPSLRTFFMAGLCGGYTTFSSFSLETLNLARDGEWLRAGANAVCSVMFCLLAVGLGRLVALPLNPSKGA
jgi:CrcB protein